MIKQQQQHKYNCYWSKFQDQPILTEPSTTYVSKPINFPLDQYLEFERNRNKHKLLQEQQKDAKPANRTQTLIKQIKDLVAEAEEKVKACIYEKSIKPSPVLSPISLNDSDSGYTEYLVETKFNEVTFQKSKPIHRPQEEVRKERTNLLSPLCYNELSNYSLKHGAETFRSTNESMSSSVLPSKPVNSKKFNCEVKHSDYVEKTVPIKINPGKKKFREQPLRKTSPKPTRHHCSCSKETGGVAEQKQVKDNFKSVNHQNTDYCQDKLYSAGNHERIDRANANRQYIDASMNTDPLLVRLNTHLINVVSSQEEKSDKMRDHSNKLCQIQELPKVVIRPNFTKQIGPIIDIQTTKPTLQQNNVAVVEYIHGGPKEGIKGTTKTDNLMQEAAVDDTPLQTVSPPAVHFRNSRDLKLLKVTKDLLGKLNFKDGLNVEKLKRSLTTLISLLNQISPIHVANVRLTSLDASTASESIDTLFSNIDLVTEIIENEIKKPTGRYCDYPECLIKAVDLLCVNIRSIFVIEDTRKRTAKLSDQGKEKNRVKKPLVKNKKQLSVKRTDITQRPNSATSTITGENVPVNPAVWKNEQDLYIPYRMLIPGRRHKAMEEAKNSGDIQLRFKRLEKVLEINQKLKEGVPSREENLQTDRPVHALIEEEKSSFKENHVLNETFIIKSGSDDESEAIYQKLETKTNKSEPDYEDDWEMDSSKSNDGSMAMTDIKVTAQVHSKDVQTLFVHSSPKKLSVSEKSFQELTSSKGSQTESILSSYSHSSTKQSQHTSKNTDKKYSNRQNKHKKKVLNEVKDVETQNSSNTRDVDCEDLQRPKVKIVKPIATSNEAASFTVLRMTNPLKNSLLEVRFPEQTENLQSSLTVQKTDNSEQIKLLYNLNIDEKISNTVNKNKSNSVSAQLFTERKGSLQTDLSDTDEKQLPRHIDNTDVVSSIQKQEELNDFQNITTNFIQFLESKVTEMVSKFKSSEVTCEKLLDQRLACPTDHKMSRNSNFHISSSKTCLKNEVFYKSASSLCSNQSNEDLLGSRNLLSRRCTPDNQEIIPFENLTSPPVGLKLKESSNLNEVINTSQNTLYDLQNKVPKSSSIGNQNINAITVVQDIERYSLKGSRENLEKSTDNKITYESVEQIKLVLKDDDENKNTHIKGFHNRLLPLPEDVISNKIVKVKNANEDEAKQIFSLTEINSATAENITRTENSNIDVVSLLEEEIEDSSLKMNKRTNEKADPKSPLFNETMLALLNTEHTFENNDNNEESTAILIQNPSKNEDDIDSQGTSAHIANILSASESGRTSSIPSVSKIPFLAVKQSLLMPKESKENVPSEYVSHQQETTKIIQPFSMDGESSNLFSFPEPIEEHQFDNRKYSENESQSNVKVHSVVIRGPSHIDKGLSSVDPILKNSIENFKENDISSQILRPPSREAAIQTIGCESFDNSSQTSPPNENAAQVAIATFDKSPQQPPTTEEAIQVSGLETFNVEEVSELFDDCIQLNYYNPEEMSEGEIGYVYTSNSYSSGEIKPCLGQNDDDSLTGPPTFREVAVETANNANETTNLLKDTTLASSRSEAVMPANLQEELNKTGQIKVEQCQEIARETCEAFSSSNDSTSTGELKDLFNAEDKIDEGLLESSGQAESIISLEDKDGND